MSLQHRPDKPSPWVARIHVGGGRQISKSFRRKVDAVAWIEEQRSQRRRGDWVDPERGEVTFGEFCSAVIDTKSHLSPRTVESYRLAARRLEPYIGDVALREISAEQLEGVVSQLSTKYAPETVAKSVRLLRMVFRKAIEFRRLTYSPAAGLKAPPIKRRPMAILTPDQVHEVSGAMPERYAAFPTVAAYTGLRFGELAGLQNDAIDLDRRRLEVKRTLVEARGQPPFLGPPKSESSARTIALPASLVVVLDEHMSKYGVDGQVFTSPDGGVLYRSNFGKVWRRAVAESIGVPCRIHDLRHTHAAWLIAAGEHPKTIQQRLGHSSISVTLDRYGHLMEGLDEGAAEKLDELFVN